MNILHITPYFAPAWSYGGVVTAVSGLAAAQIEQGHQVTVLTTDALDATTRSPIRRESINGVQVVRCRNLSNLIRARYSLSLPPGFWRTFRDLARRADVVHTHELRTVENLLIDHSKPVILSPHGTLSHETGRGAVKQAWDVLFGKRLARKLDGVAALTQTETNEVCALWQSLDLTVPLIRVIPNGIPANFGVSGSLRERYGLGSGPVLLFLGRLHERKGLQYLIPAFARVVAQYPDARLLIVGPDQGMRGAAETLVAQQNITDRVVFTGLLEGADQRAALASADLFVLPAVGEGLSMALLEAMAAGLPVIVTLGCNLPEVEPRGVGLLVEREVEPLAQALDTLLRDPARRRTMGQAAQQWVQEQFTWPRVAEQTEMFYHEVVDRRTIVARSSFR